MGLSSGLGFDTELGYDDVGMAGRQSVTEAIKVEETSCSSFLPSFSTSFLSLSFLLICLDPMMTWQFESSRNNTRVDHSNPICHRWNFNLHVRDGVFKGSPNAKTKSNYVQNHS